jgi:phosphoglycerate dehydrogenase-like enzyme
MTEHDSQSSAILLAVDPAAVTLDHIERVAALAPGREILVGPAADLAGRDHDRIEIGYGSLPPDRLLALPRLRWFQQWAAGAEWLVGWPQAAERDFVLTSASGVSAAVVVEQVFGCVLSLTRRLPDAWAFKEQKVWRKPPPDRFAELAGKTLLVAGLGAIGSRVARAAGGFDVRVLGIRRDSRLEAVGVERTGGPGDLHAFLPEADVVVSALPHTRETVRFFSADAFARMKPGAIFVSVGRGKVVDEPALISALESGALAGAAMDVFETEPLPAESPLWSIGTAIVTPHWGAAFPGRFERTMELFLDNLARFMSGRTLRNVVDKRRGY